MCYILQSFVQTARLADYIVVLGITHFVCAHTSHNCLCVYHHMCPRMHRCAGLCSSGRQCYHRFITQGHNEAWTAVWTPASLVPGGGDFWRLPHQVIPHKVEQHYHPTLSTVRGRAQCLCSPLQCRWMQQRMSSLSNQSHHIGRYCHSLHP